MNVVGRVGSFITQGMYSVATPFHPFGGAVDIIVVKQHDGTYRSTPWYVRFGKFQGVLKGAEKLVKIEVNGVEADFYMHLNNSGEACFVREIDPDKDDSEDNENIGMARLERTESDNIFYEFQDDLEEITEYGSSTYDNVDESGRVQESQDSNSEVVLVSVDGQMLKARLSSSERDDEDLQLNTPRFHLGPVKGAEEFNSDVATLGDTDGYLSDFCVSEHNKCTTEDGKHLDHAQETEADNENNSPGSISNSSRKTDLFKSCVELSELAVQSKEGEQGAVTKLEIGEKSPASEEQRSDAKPVERETGASVEDMKPDSIPGLEISLCGNLLYPGMSSSAAEEAFNTNLISAEEYRLSAPYIVQNENLIARVQGKYLPWDKAAHIVLGKAAFGLDLTIDSHDTIPLKQDTPDAKEDPSEMVSTPSRRWRLWPIPFRRAKSLEHSHSSLSNDEYFVDSESMLDSVVSTPSPRFSTQSPGKKILRTNLPTTDQIASLNLKDGQNVVKFIFSTRVLGVQKVEAHIYLWKWNTRIVISDVDGTITKSDVLGQFMPLVGRDWSHTGIARLFSAIKENGYQLMFLSARAIVQSYLTKSFLINLKQDGNSLPNGPVVISPDGLFPSLYREVIRRAPHEFKIACLEDIKALFPPDYNPFYAGFGNRDTDELSYRKMGIPKGKIFIINPKGEVAINRRNDVKSYTSLHTLVDDMFPPTSLANEMLSPTSLVEQEEYNSWNFWKVPLPDID